MAPTVFYVMECISRHIDSVRIESTHTQLLKQKGPILLARAFSLVNVAGNLAFEMNTELIKLLWALGRSKSDSDLYVSHNSM